MAGGFIFEYVVDVSAPITGIFWDILAYDFTLHPCDLRYPSLQGYAVIAQATGGRTVMLADTAGRPSLGMGWCEHQATRAGHLPSDTLWLCQNSY